MANPVQGIGSHRHTIKGDRDEFDGSQHEALVLRQNRAFVFRISADDKAEKVRVEIGDSARDPVAVRGELAASDRVAIRGAENLAKRADVKILVSKAASTNDNDAVMQRSRTASAGCYPAASCKGRCRLSR